MTKKITLEQLQTVAYDNIRDNQIGGQTNGISWDVAEDMGFTRPEDVSEVFEQATAIRNASLDAVAPKAGKLTIAQMNANEKAHIDKARKDRYGR